LTVTGGRFTPDLARNLVDPIAERFPDRIIHLVAGCGCRAFIGLGDGMSMTNRATFHHLAPPRTGTCVGHRLKGNPKLEQ
jgi:hypothetical protein